MKFSVFDYSTYEMKHGVDGETPVDAAARSGFFQDIVELKAIPVVESAPSPRAVILVGASWKDPKKKEQALGYCLCSK